MTTARPQGYININVSHEVHEYLKSNGRFGESFDDVLRRLLNVKQKVRGNITSKKGLTVYPEVEKK